MEELMFLLNSLGDDWYKRRTGRSYEHDVAHFRVTFVQDTPEGMDPRTAMPTIHVSYPLEPCTLQFDLAEAHEMDLELRLPKVGISLDWVYGELEGAPCQTDPDDVTTLFLKKGPIWTMRVRKEQVCRDLRVRVMLERTRLADNADIEGRFPVRDSSDWIRHTDVMLVDGRDLSPTARYFARKFPFASIGPAEDILTRVRSVSTWSSPALRPDHTAEAFLARPGRLDLRLLEPRDGDGMGRIKLEDGREFSIVSGYWIHPQSVSIMQRNVVDGLIMDTTFRVIPSYHTAV
jgi:hypothetical protein